MVVTAHESDEARAALAQVGVDMIVPKSLTVVEIVNRVGRIHPYVMPRPIAVTVMA